MLPKGKLNQVQLIDEESDQMWALLLKDFDISAINEMEQERESKMQSIIQNASGSLYTNMPKLNDDNKKLFDMVTHTLPSGEKTLIGKESGPGEISHQNKSMSHLEGHIARKGQKTEPSQQLQQVIAPRDPVNIPEQHKSKFATAIGALGKLKRTLDTTMSLSSKAPPPPPPPKIARKYHYAVEEPEQMVD